MKLQNKSVKTPVYATPGQRQLRQLDLFFLSKNKALKCHSKFLKGKAGRNHKGKINVRHHGGRNKRLYRVVDFARNEGDGVVLSIDYDPFRKAPLARVFNFKSGSFFYILAPKNLYPSSIVRSFKDDMAKEIVSLEKGETYNNEHVDTISQFWDNCRNIDAFRLSLGDSVKLSEFPNGSSIYALSTANNQKGSICRSAGTNAVLLQKNMTHARIKLPSGSIKVFPVTATATYGVVANEDSSSCQIGKAGRARWLGKRPIVRGVAMNPVDHPHGGGEGKTSGGRPSVTPWGKPTRGRKTSGKKKKSKSINL